jgi:hypothetical protein
MALTETWNDRLFEIRAIGDRFTYDELAEIWDISKPNISISIDRISEDYPDAISSQTVDGGRKEFRFNWESFGDDLQEPDEEDGFPDWLAKPSYRGILSKLKGELPDDYELRFEKLDYADEHGWDQQFQRGGVKVVVYEAGQKQPEFTRAFRLDNCIVISS